MVVVNPRVESTVSAELLGQLRQIAPATIGHMLEHEFMDPELRPIISRFNFAGPAVTVRCFGTDSAIVHYAVDIAQPGDVIVIDTNGSSMGAVLGDLVSTKARHRGIAGFVVDGLIRDVTAIRGLGDFPVFARGVTPIGPLHRGPGEINHPICAGGIVVNPGDVVVGDLNGVVVVPREIAAELLERLVSRKVAEAHYTRAVARGDFSNDWVDRTLEAGGVEVEGVHEPV